MFVSTFVSLILAVPALVSAVPVGPPPKGHPIGAPSGFPSGFPTSRSSFPNHPTSTIGVSTRSTAATSASSSPSSAGNCDLSSAVVDIPTNQTAIPQASGKVSFVAIGVGFQNYTCGSAGTYTSTGAVASLFDISCLLGQPAFDTIQDSAMSAWNASSGSAADIISAIPEANGAPLLGDHFFVTNPVTGTGISPDWNFAKSFPSNPNAFVIAAKQGNIAAPTGKQDVDWLFLTAVSGQGALADSIYRTDTRLGQPPASCTAGDPGKQIKYVAKYWLLGGSVKN